MSKPAIWRNPWLWGAVAGLIFVPLVRPLTRRVPDPPPVSGQAPPYELMDHRGNPFGSRELKDRVYLANFINVQCDAACDARLNALVGLQRRLIKMGVKLWLVSYSTDPEHDTPNELRALVERHGGKLYDVDANQPPTDYRWIILTGHPSTMRDLQTGVFWPQIRHAMDALAPRPTAPEAAWSVLVDGDGGLRGAYPSDDDGLYEVFHRSMVVMSLRRAWR